MNKKENLLFVGINFLLLVLVTVTGYAGWLLPLKNQSPLQYGVLIKSLVFLLVIANFIYYLKKKQLFLFVIGFSTVFLTAAVLSFSHNNLFYDLGGDNWYLNALVTKYSHYITWMIDAGIKDISSHISPLFFWLAGILSRFTGWNSPETLMIFSFTCIFAFPVLYYLIIKDQFDRLVVILAILLGAVFFNDELVYKPYQAIASLLSLYLYYHLTAQVDGFANRVVFLKAALLGLAIYLLHDDHFLYLIIVFAVELFLKKVVLHQDVKGQSRSFFLLYGTILLAGVVLFLLPQLMDVIRLGTIYQVMYGSTENIELIYLSFPFILGFLDLLKNYDHPFSFKSLVLVLGLTSYFLLNLFLEACFGFHLNVFKVQNLIVLILLPHAIRYVYQLVFSEKTDKYSRLFTDKLILFLFVVFSLNAWSSYCINYKKGSGDMRFWSENADKIMKEVDLKDKVVFFPSYNSDLEYGSFIPNFRFLPVNNDYGAPGSRLTERVAFMRQLDSVKYNPAAVAYLLMNNPFEKIDYLLWNDQINKWSWCETGAFGQKGDCIDREGDKRCLSSRYFAKVNPSVPYLYQLKHDQNFVEKPDNKQLFLEKVALGKITAPYYDRFIQSLTNMPLLYDESDINDAVYFLRNVEKISDGQADSVYRLAPHIYNKYEAEIEWAPSNIDNQAVTLKDPQASGGYCRKIDPADNLKNNVLFFGPYKTILHGRYKLIIYARADNKVAIPVMNVDVFSGKTGKVYHNVELWADQIYHEQKFIRKEVVFEMPEAVSDLEIRGFFHNNKIPVSVDKYELIREGF